MLWCGAPGLPETVPVIVADLTPVIAVGVDLQSRAGTDPNIPDLGTPDAGGFPVFQLAVPMADAFDVLAGYASTDRGFTRTGLVWSTASAGADKAWAVACADHQLDASVSPTYDASGGLAGILAVVGALRDAHVQFVVLALGATEAAGVVSGLDAISARYIDTPSALKVGFRPMVAGLAAATGTTTFTSLAGAHAAKGTIAVSTLGAATGLPRLPHP